MHSALICLDDHEVYTLGSGKKYQLGHGDTDTLYEPKKVKNLPENVAYLAAGGGLNSSHSVAVTGQWPLRVY